MIQSRRGPVISNPVPVSAPGCGGRTPVVPPSIEGEGSEDDEGKETGIGFGNSGARSSILINAEESNPCGQTATGLARAARIPQDSAIKMHRLLKPGPTFKCALRPDKDASRIPGLRHRNLRRVCCKISSPRVASNRMVPTLRQRHVRVLDLSRLLYPIFCEKLWELILLANSNSCCPLRPSSHPVQSNLRLRRNPPRCPAGLRSPSSTLCSGNRSSNSA